MSKEIVTSTGKLGAEERSFDRFAVNATVYSDDPMRVSTFADRSRAVAAAKEREGLTRTTFRGLVSQRVMDEIIRTGNQKHLEVALPVGEFTEGDEWLVHAAKNAPARTVLTPVDRMIEETEGDKICSQSPLEKVNAVKEKGYKIIDSFSEADIDQVHSLWEETFGWSREEVDNLRHRIDDSKYADTEEKGVWFNGIRNTKGELISIAMAEKLTIPAADGKELDTIEVTELSVDPAYEGQGIMSANVAVLNAQILDDYENRNLPLIYAECNFQSRAERSAHRAVMRIPERMYAPQILQQNVGVGDRVPVESPYRDFQFLYLPRDMINAHYTPEIRREMREEVIYERSAA